MDYNDISEQWLTENQDLHKLSEEIAPIEFGLERMERCLTTEFKLISFMTQTSKHVDKLNKHPEQFKLNRYPQYMTFEKTRVVLGKEQDKNQIDNYINANFIQIQGKQSIATQAPINKFTIYNFWRMVEQYKVNKIFMLTGVMEKGKLKCDRYFPQNAEPQSKIVQKQYEITLLEEYNYNPKKTVKVRKIQLTNKITNYTHVITHFQILDWLDGEVPQKKNKKWISQLVNEFLEDIKENKTPIVHCSAGVGRTGTFIMMAVIRLLVTSNQNISIFNEVRKMREQRWGMVHTSSQYEFIYEFTEREISRLHSGIGGFSEESEGSEEDEKN